MKDERNEIKHIQNNTEGTDENENNQNNAEVKKVICDYILDMYQIEWQRTRDIENKATGIVGFTGVIFSLTIASLFTIISSVDEVTKDKIFSSSIFVPILISFILVIMTLSIFCGITALDVKKWWFLIADKFLDYFTNKKTTKEKIHSEIADEVTKGIVFNRNNNEKIANYLTWSYILFLLSIVLLVIYTIYILDIFI